MKLAEKTILITGSSKGIGAATAKKFSEERANIIITYNQDKQGAEKTAQQCKEAGVKTTIIQLDVTNHESINKAFNKIQEQGGIDILINNAGIAVWKPFNNTSTEEISSLIRTNIEGAIITAKKALEQGAHTIINIGSGAGITPYNNLAVYCATKAAIRMFTQAAKNDATMLCVNPGMTATNMTNQQGTDPGKVAEIIVEAAKGTYKAASGDDINVWEHL